MQEKEFRLEPYRDDEALIATQELFSTAAFKAGIESVLPKELVEYYYSVVNDVHSIYDFQKKIVYPFLKMVQSTSINNLTVNGLDYLNSEDRYLFISNHRDIALDTAYLNMLLFENQIKTSQMAIGDNLILDRIAELVFRLNKSFIVKRTGAPRELYGYSVKLSEYTRDLILSKTESAWIAQREGRAKDGNDTTQTGLLKMLSLAAKKGELKAYFKSLKVVPVAISYEYDPCDVAKTDDFLKKKENPNYKKHFKEDMQQILMGIQGQKGNVHFEFHAPLDVELDKLDTAKNNKERLEILGKVIDEAIQTSYQINPISYIAADILAKTNDYAAHYTIEQRKEIEIQFENKLKHFAPNEYNDARQYLLGMYANPLINQLSWKTA